ncbi:MAG: hypothetical protein HYV77_02650 [Candidatus Wildermuthbacteria bacterium]|nr:hypothetical protein [Candidatus Wildermuthbacteria bacterium]
MINVKNIVLTLQKQPEEKRKLILWAATILLGIVLLGWWIKGIADKVPEMRQAKDNLKQDIGVPNIPSFDKLQEE